MVLIKRQLRLLLRLCLEMQWMIGTYQIVNYRQENIWDCHKKIMNNGLLKVGEQMVKGDIFTMPIVFALQEVMKQFENYDNDNGKMIYESLRRSKVIWENIRIHGLNASGMTYEQFCDQCNKKKNIVFLSDDEVEDFNKAVQIMNVMRN